MTEESLVFRVNLVLLAIFIAISAMLIAARPALAAHFLAFDSGQGTKTVYYINYSKYDSEVSYAVNQWNSLGQFQFINGFGEPGLVVDQYSDCTTNTEGYWAGTNPGTDKIFFNTCYADGHRVGDRYIPHDDATLHVHEFGHAVGLADHYNEDTQNQRFQSIMYYCPVDCQNVGPQPLDHDVQDYNVIH